MNTGLPPAQRILVLAPHPDDESLGCGGTIARYTRNGALVELVVVSDGAALDEPDGRHDDLVAARLEEVKAAAAILSLQNIHTLALPDGQLSQHEMAIQKAIHDRILVFQPDLVLAPSPIDGHQDHVTVGQVALQLFRRVPGWVLAFYEVLVPLHYNWLVDISDVLSVKKRAALCYQRSLFQQPALFWEAFQALNLFKSAFVHRHGFFEALWVLQSPPTDQEVIAWTTYDFRSSDGNQLSVQSVREVDELVFALHEKAKIITQSEQRQSVLQRENEELRQTLQVHVATGAALQKTLDQHTSELERLRKQVSVRGPRGLRPYIDRAFPIGTPRRAALSALKRRIAQYTSKSPRE